jgi:hypothetical protein
MPGGRDHDPEHLTAKQLTRPPVLDENDVQAHVVEEEEGG